MKPCDPPPELAALKAVLAGAGTLTVAVKVLPKSARNEIVGFLGQETLKVKIAAPPEKGKANAALCAFLAEQFGVPKGNVSVESGHTSARKRVRIVR